MIKTAKQHKEALKRYDELNAIKKPTNKDISELKRLISNINHYAIKRWPRKPVKTEDLVIMAHEFRGISKDEITPTTMEEVMTLIYGKRGTKKRDEAEKKIKEMRKTVVERAEKKAFCEEIENHMERIRIRKTSNIR